MTLQIPRIDPAAPALVLDIGNTTITIGTWHEGKVKSPVAVPNDDSASLHDAINAQVDSMVTSSPAAVAIASVVPDVLDRVRAHLDEMFDRDSLVVGERIALPVDVGVDDPRAIGVDRVCSAAAAFETLETGCTIVDFGSAVTVDLVDDNGVLVGGAILPGLKMQLRAMHEYTAILPEVEPGFPELPYGCNTEQAMQTGVCRGLAGAVRGIVEGYATFLNRWPQVLATGGDVDMMLPHCDFLDTAAANLVLRGVGVAYSKHISRVRL